MYVTLYTKKAIDKPIKNQAFTTYSYAAGGRGVASSNLVIPTEKENADNQGDLPDNQCFLFLLDCPLEASVKIRFSETYSIEAPFFRAASFPLMISDIAMILRGL